MAQKKHSDLFITTLHELHSKSPLELLESLREHLQHIRESNPNSAQTAEACLAGLASDDSTLLHVLTAAYLINGGVMLKHTLGDEEKTLTELEEELLSFGINEDQETLYGYSPSPPPAREPAASGASRPPAAPSPSAPS
jgi:hypothetical protein